jgi:glycosyltransferase involved in cell wall biosynthesis
MASQWHNRRVLVGIPAYNEEPTIEEVVTRVRHAAPDFDLLVVNDGSRDATGAILERLNVATATHLANLGYSAAITTAIRFARTAGYDALITLDSDGQHAPEQIVAVYNEFEEKEFDYLIGSRYLRSGYEGAPLLRRLGMQFFSRLTKVMTGVRRHDTTSGFRVLRNSVFAPLLARDFVDYHAEAIVYVSRLGFRIGEFPIDCAEREHGESMYSLRSAFTYPLKTLGTATLLMLEAASSRNGVTSR